MKHLSLFSGIGGLDLAAEWAGFETVAFVERDAWCQAVLRKRWPGVPIFDDIRACTRGTLGYPDLHLCGRDSGPVRGEEKGVDSEGRQDGRQPLGPPDAGDDRIQVVSGGFPCQPHSVAGLRKASADDRDLWPEFARIVREIRPRWVVAENVPGLLTSESGRFFGTVLGDLAAMGYRTGWGVWGASDVGALHRRDRVFIVANAERERGCSRPTRREDATDAGQPPRHPGGRTWDVEPAVGRVADGVPGRAHRLRALGNAVVPQQAYPLFAEIARIERAMNPLPLQGHSE